MARPPRPILLAGPTAVGKSAVALCLAQRIQGEILSVDSMQVYKGMDLGTAKASLADRAQVPHHFIDLLELDQSFDAAQFAAQARALVARITSHGQVPILCGGTGLYFQAFLHGVGTGPPADPELRARLEQQPLAALLDELARRDPAEFERIDRQNRRRVVRALEVITISGQPAAQQRASWGEAPGKQTAASSTSPGLFFCLDRSRDDLRARISQRVDEMFAAGLVTETQRLLERGLANNRTALQALGYRQVVEFLEGRRSLPETIALVKQKTWHYAKRQRTWFRRQPVEWVQIDVAETVQNVANRLAARYGEWIGPDRVQLHPGGGTVYSGGSSLSN